MSVSNEKIYDFLLEMKGDIGEIKKGLESNESHTLHVSRKVDGVREALTEHAKDETAHGMGAERRGRGAVSALLISLVSATAAALGVLKFIAPLASAGNK